MSSKTTLQFRKIAKYESHFLLNRENMLPCRKLGMVQVFENLQLCELLYVPGTIYNSFN